MTAPSAHLNDSASADDTACALLPPDISQALLDPKAYAQFDDLHGRLLIARRQYPFSRANLEGYDPFWVTTRYADMREILRRNDLFLSGTPVMQSRAEREYGQTVGNRKLYRTIIAMNPPEHMKYRMLTQAWFQPKNIRHLEERFRVIARHYVDRFLGTGGNCEFVGEVAAHYPLMVIMSILGAPIEDEPMLLKLTQQFFGDKDPDLAGAEAADSTRESEARRGLAIATYNQYFHTIAEDRRRKPTDDVASVIANATIDGAPIPQADATGYFITIASAGHDTTSSSLAGGLWALAERPELLAAVKLNRDLIPKLVEEAVRWTTPVQHLMRTAGSDCEVAGQKVGAGERIFISLTSGNRDEEFFERPFEFRLDRPLNTQTSFGYGPHLCLGLHLARMEMSIFYEELLPRLKTLELAGQPSRMVSNFVGGPKALPIRFTVQR